MLRGWVRKREDLDGGGQGQEASWLGIEVRDSLHLAARHGAVYTSGKGSIVLAPVRFVWNATRGHRLTPWRSEYLRWRVETYSGQPAETLTAGKILSFVWATRWELLSFLLWTNQLERDANRQA
jgi:hypothetical protein